ncbi:uncharacterized protein A4U43_C09F10540 [Asparagus officinalis]|uniref:DUF948 domain-containing protein n=1 Tax=Asparagus officinalis TaxID=4686 RepID=A0A5P1E750_ASPOF|nr:uncharacterized protein LOC109824451 [Asparagus officinalis]ONK58279.1 uncharacterized protein A4U43_C09F10540 [Asparagus officinalis]
MLLSPSSSSPRTLHLPPSPALTHRIHQNPHRNPNFSLQSPKSPRLFVSRRPSCCGSNRPGDAKLEVIDGSADVGGGRMSTEVGNPSLPVRIGMCRMSLGDQAFLLLAFIACTTSIAFASLVIAAIPTLYAMKRAATSLAKLADTAREELPSTMAAIRLSGMEISDLTLELSDLSQEIADGVNKSAQAVQAAEAGIRQIGALARSKTISMIQERANLPNISLQPVVAGAAKKTSNAVGHAKKTFMNLISRGDDYGSDNAEEGFDNTEC